MFLFPPEDEIDDGSDFNEVARLARQRLGIVQPKPGERIRWPEKKPEVELAGSMLNVREKPIPFDKLKGRCVLPPEDFEDSENEEFARLLRERLGVAAPTLDQPTRTPSENLGPKR